MALRFMASGATTACEAHTNVADESICLLTDNIRNEGVTIHRSQEVLKMLSCQLRFDLTFDDILREPTAKMNTASYIVQLQGMDYCCFLESNVQQLRCPSCTDFNTPVS
jgi:hypothetical protein